MIKCFFSLILICLIITSCIKDGPNPFKAIPPEPEGIYAEIDSIAFSAPAAKAIVENNIMTIKGLSPEGKKITIILPDYHFITKDYSLKKDSLNTAVLELPTGEYSNISGVFSVKETDNIHKVLRGSFSFSAKNGDSIEKVKNGIFKIHYDEIFHNKENKMSAIFNFDSDTLKFPSINIDPANGFEITGENANEKIILKFPSTITTGNDIDLTSNGIYTARYINGTKVLIEFGTVSFNHNADAKSINGSFHFMDDEDGNDIVGEFNVSY